MSIRWEYLTLSVSRGSTRISDRELTQDRYGLSAFLRRKSDWIASLPSGGQLDGWDEILEYCSKNGWEVFSVVAVDKITYHEVTRGSYGGTESFRLFAKRPKNE